MRQNVWIVSELFYPDQTSTGYIITEIANSLAVKNQVKVICGPARYTMDLDDPSTELDPSIQLLRVNLGNWDKDKILSRIIRFVLLTIRIGIKLIRNVNSGDKVVMVTNPAPILLFVSRICKWKKLKLVIIVHDVFPENLNAAHMIKEDGYIYKVLLHLFNKAYRSANLLIVLGRDMKKVLTYKTHLTDGNIKVIENWADTQNIYPMDTVREGIIKLQFAGNFGRVQGLVQLISAIRTADNPYIMIDFLGAGAVLEEMRKYVYNHRLANVAILPPFRRSEQLRILNNCDISVVSLATGMCGLGVPSKIYNILAAGKPVLYIGDMESEIALLIKENPIGWAFPDYGNELINFLMQLNVSCRKQLVNKGKSARKLAETRYDKSIIISEYNKAIDSI